MTTYHVAVPIQRAIEEIHKGNNMFDCTPLEAFHALMDALDEGKTYFTGCDNMKKDGTCGGHDNKKE